MPSLMVSVEGHLRSRSNKDVGGYYVFVKGIAVTDWGKGHAVTNKQGDFHLEFNTGEESNVAFFYVNGCKDTILLSEHVKITSTI
jgi:hypothetical protein